MARRRSTKEVAIGKGMAGTGLEVGFKTLSLL
jgi:hypothetical protein